jgi:hypothetical protein
MVEQSSATAIRLRLHPSCAFMEAVYFDEDAIVDECLQKMKQQD